MSVLIEAISVVLRCDTIAARLHGGMRAFATLVPNGSFRSDGRLAAAGFQTPEDCGAFIDDLEGRGFRFLSHGRAVDIVVVDQLKGPTCACDWIELGRDDRGVHLAWLAGGPRGELAVPKHWVYEGSLSQTPIFIPTEEMGARLHHMGRKNSVDVYLDQETGAEVYVGKAYPGPVTDERTRHLHDMAQAQAVEAVHRHMEAEGWSTLAIDTARSADMHLIMRYHNQLGLVFVESECDGTPVSVLDADRQNRLIAKARALNALPLRGAGRQSPRSRYLSSRGIQIGLWRSALLHDLLRHAPWTPQAYDLEALIEMSDWEVHDFGIQFLRETLKSQGHRIRSWTSDLDTDPQIIAEIDGRRTFIMVRTARFPVLTASFDAKALRAMIRQARAAGACAMLAPVSVASVEDSFDGVTVTPPYRGHGLVVRFTGLRNAEADPVPSRRGR